MGKPTTPITSSAKAPSNRRRAAARAASMAASTPTGSAIDGPAALAARRGRVGGVLAAASAAF
jgi:hypothetical protein